MKETKEITKVKEERWIAQSDAIFEAQGKLELTRTLLGVLLNLVDGKPIKTEAAAVAYAAQQDTFGDMVRIAVDNVHEVIGKLGEVLEADGKGA